MIKKITLKNYKSILDLELELGKFNVFIGENGSGKTNILEAVGMIAAAKNQRTSIQDLSNLGMRVAKPDLTFSSFLNKKSDRYITNECVFLDEKGERTIKSKISSSSKEDLYGNWLDEEELFMLAFNLDDIEKFLNGQSFSSITDEKSDAAKIIAKNNKPGTIYSSIKRAKKFNDYLKNYTIYNLESQALRGITNTSLKTPLGIHGERLDLFLASFSDAELKKLYNFKYLVSWLDEIIIDNEGKYRLSGLKTEGKSSLYFTDKFMEDETLFNIENANEGILHILFYLALFISNKSPNFFAIDNIETALNPALCRHLTEVLSTMNPNKQALITTHNPAILDGLDLTNDDIRLFEVRRTEAGYTACRRIQFKKGAEKKFKLSEMWMKGLLGASPKNF